MLVCVIMITALRRERELRKAMNLHLELLKLGFKPGDAIFWICVIKFHYLSSIRKSSKSGMLQGHHF